MKKIILILIITIIGIVKNPLSTQNVSGKEIMIMVDDRYTGDDKQSEIEMILINKNNKKRIRNIVSYAKEYGNDTKKIMFFNSPTDVKGTGFLSWEYEDTNKEDDRWLYLPALRKTRRIAGASNNDYFMGSDFTYDDMGGRNVEEDIHELIGEITYDENECYEVKSTPLGDDDYYTYKTSIIRKDISMVVNVKYYNVYGLMKELKINDIKTIDNIETAHQMVMENYENKHKTVLNISNIRYNTGIEDNLFKVSTIERGRL